jgi:hypothetical protein
MSGNLWCILSLSFGVTASLDAAQSSAPDLPSLPMFASASEAERFVDGVAMRLGCPTKVEARWAREHCSRELKYRDRQGNLELAVRIARDRVIEGRPRWSMKCAVTGLHMHSTIQMPPRLRATSFEKDARELLARVHRARPV